MASGAARQLEVKRGKEPWPSYSAVDLGLLDIKHIDTTRSLSEKPSFQAWASLHYLYFLLEGILFTSRTPEALWGYSRWKEARGEHLLVDDRLVSESFFSMLPATHFLHLT